MRVATSRAAAALGAGLLAACQPVPTDRPAPHVDPSPSPFKGRWDELALQRGTCERECPAFHILVRPSGEVLWSGQAHVEPLGVRLGRVDPAAVDTVVEHIVAAGILAAAPEYDSRVTHTVTIESSLTLDDATHRLRDRGRAAPEPLLEALTEIDALVPTIRWYSLDSHAPPDSSCSIVHAAARRLCDAYFDGAGTHEPCEHALGLSSLAATVTLRAPPSVHGRACALIAASPALRPPAPTRAPLTIRVAACREYVERIRHGCSPDRGSTLDCHLGMDIVDGLLKDERKRRVGTHPLSEEGDTNMCKWLLRHLD